MKRRLAYTDTLMIQKLAIKTIEFLDKLLGEFGIQNAMHRRMVLRTALDILLLQETADLFLDELKKWSEEEE